MYVMVPVLFYASERTLTSVHEHNHQVGIIKVCIREFSFGDHSQIQGN